MQRFVSDAVIPILFISISEFKSSKYLMHLYVFKQLLGSDAIHVWNVEGSQSKLYQPATVSVTRVLHVQAQMAIVCYRCWCVAEISLICVCEEMLTFNGASGSYIRSLVTSLLKKKPMNSSRVNLLASH